MPASTFVMSRLQSVIPAIVEGEPREWQMGCPARTGPGRAAIAGRLVPCLPPSATVTARPTSSSSATSSDPIPVDDQVLVRVRAASVNRADLDGSTPRPAFVRLFMGLRAPRNHRLGLDVAGVVERVGPGATRFRPGDEVFADLFVFGQGAFAEYVCAPERAFAADPGGMSFEDAATLPHSAILAVQGLRLRNGRTVGPGDKVLIDGASGNVGPFAVQIAKSLGAEVTGVCSTGKIGLRPVARRRPRDRLHDGRLHGDRRALRLDRRHGFAPLDPARPARAPAERRLRDARRHGAADPRGAGARAADLAATTAGWACCSGGSRSTRPTSRRSRT